MTFDEARPKIQLNIICVLWIYCKNVHHCFVEKIFFGFIKPTVHNDVNQKVNISKKIFIKNNEFFTNYDIEKPFPVTFLTFYSSNIIKYKTVKKLEYF